MMSSCTVTALLALLHRATPPRTHTSLRSFVVACIAFHSTCHKAAQSAFLHVFLRKFFSCSTYMETYTERLHIMHRHAHLFHVA
eukprot:m.65918 g.65918  ORF g.65918 m.65918 type:complete len:84 (-) comp12081_c1_seq1:251-502(-)